MSSGPTIWLYPISEGSDYVFSAHGRKWPTSPAGFAEMIRHGGADDRWTIHSNRRRVAPGDKVVVYASKKPTRGPLIVGIGTLTSASEWYAPWNRFTIRIRWDRQQCLDLAVSPIDATHLMQHLPMTKGAVMGLPGALQSWIRDRLQIREGMADRFRDYLRRAEKVKGIKVKKGAYRALLRHNARLVSPFRARLVRSGWEIMTTSETSLELEADIVAARAGQALIVEAKTTKQGDGRREIREAIGQLLDYEYFLLPRLLPKSVKGVHLLILLEHAPRPQLATFAERSGFLIAWFSGKGLRGGSKTTALMNKLL